MKESRKLVAIPLLLLCGCGSDNKKKPTANGTDTTSEVDRASDVAEVKKPVEGEFSFGEQGRAALPQSYSLGSETFSLSLAPDSGVVLSKSDGTRLSAPLDLSQWTASPAVAQQPIVATQLEFAPGESTSWTVEGESIKFRSPIGTVSLPWKGGAPRVVEAGAGSFIVVANEKVSGWVVGKDTVNDWTLDLPAGLEEKGVEGAGYIDGHIWVYGANRLYAQELKAASEWSVSRIAFTSSEVRPSRVSFSSPLEGSAGFRPTRAVYTTQSEVVVSALGAAGIAPRAKEGVIPPEVPKPAASLPSASSLPPVVAKPPAAPPNTQPPPTTSPPTAPSNAQLPPATLPPAAPSLPPASPAVPPSAPVAGPVPKAPPNYDSAVKPVVQEFCVKCHSKYATRAQLDNDRRRILSSVESGSMPKGATMSSAKKTILLDYVKDLISKE